MGILDHFPCWRGCDNDQDRYRLLMRAKDGTDWSASLPRNIDWTLSLDALFQGGAQFVQIFAPKEKEK